MAEASLASAIVPLVSVVIGGGLTLAGQWFMQDRQAEAEKKRRKAEKFEELVAALYDHRHWLKTMRDIRAFGEDGEETGSPFARVQAIGAAYFPELSAAIAPVDAASYSYEVWMFGAAQRRLRNEENFASGASEEYEKYCAAWWSLLAKLKDYAKKEFQ